ncbi:hypothetical protein PPS11_09803 [Pseudomonas putida S11]|nr:hypothetical protein PPS11_09803 [Pseudomonas putida S11]
MRKVTLKGLSVFYTKLLAGDLPVLGGFVGVEQNVIPGHGVGSRSQGAKCNEEFEEGHNRLPFLELFPFIDTKKRFSKLAKRCFRVARVSLAIFGE